MPICEPLRTPVQWDCFDEKTTTKTNKRWFDWSQIQNSGLGFIRHIRINWEMLRSGHNIILVVSANFYYKNTTACFATKGQLISKGLFAILEFFQKMNQWIHCSSKNEFVCSFFEEFEDSKSPFEIIWPLSKCCLWLLNAVATHKMICSF